MKHIFAAMLAVLLLLLCACSKTEPTPETTAPHAAPVETVQPSTEPEAPWTEPIEAEAAEESENIDLKAIAESLIGEPVDALYEAIGYPESSDYAPSCLVEDGEDGNLYYDGFIVYTTRKGDTETVYYVE